MTRFGKRRIVLTATVLTAALVMSLLALVPGGLRPAQGQTAGPTQIQCANGTFVTPALGQSCPSPVPCPNGTFAFLPPNGPGCPSTTTSTTSAANSQVVTTASTATTYLCNGTAIPLNQLCVLPVPVTGARFAPIGIIVPFNTGAVGSLATSTTTGGTGAPTSNNVGTPAPGSAAAAGGPVTGLTLTGTAATTPSAATQPPANVLPDSPVFAATTTDTADAGQRAIATADVTVAGSSTPVQAASVDVPAGAACGGSGAYTLTISSSDQSQPLSATVGGSCAGGAPLTFSAPVRVCVTIGQFILDAERADNGTGLTLLGNNGQLLSNVSMTGSQVCGDTSSPGTFTVAVVVPAPTTP